MFQPSESITCITSMTHDVRTALVKKLAEAQNNLCPYCQFPMAIPSVAESVKGSNLMTIEHVIPRSLGGTDEETNLVAACKKCNSMRSNYDHLIFARIIQNELQNCTIADWHQITVREPVSQRTRRDTITDRVLEKLKEALENNEL